MPTPKKKPTPTPKPITPEDKRKQQLKNYETAVKKTNVENVWNWVGSEVERNSKRATPEFGSTAVPVIAGIVATPVAAYMDLLDSAAKPKKKGGKK